MEAKMAIYFLINLLERTKIAAKRSPVSNHYEQLEQKQDVREVFKSEHRLRKAGSG